MVCEALPSDRGDLAPACSHLASVARTLVALPGRDSGTADATGDDVLIAAAQRNPADFAPLYERYVDAIYRYVLRRVGDPVEAEDLTAQTFQQALQALPAYEWRGVPFSAWLYRIARNLLTNRGRKSGREINGEAADAIVAALPAIDSDPALEVERRLADSGLLAALRHLPVEQQRLIKFKFVEGLTNREIAERLGRSEGAIKQLTLRTLRRLRGELAHTEHGAPGRRAAADERLSA